MIKLVASDIDGTLVEETNIIPKNNIDAIKKMMESNINFTICTGKPYSMMKKTCKDLQANYGIFGNGNQIIDLKSGKEIYRKTLKYKDIFKCIAWAKQENLHIHFYTDSQIVTSKLMYMDLRNFLLKDSELYKNKLEFKVTPDIEKYINDNKPNIFKLVISSNSNLNKFKKVIEDNTDLTVYRIEKYDKYKDTIINKEYEYLDVTPKGTNKNEALSILRNYLELSSSEVMAIGDNLNDLEMIKNSGIGVAVANAYDEVKQIATYTTEKVARDGGFAEAVYKYISF